MNTEELEILYNKISNDNKYRPIIDCITNKLRESIEKEVRTRIMDQFIAKEQLLDRCENNEIIYKIAKTDLNENQILAMVNNHLKTKNNILIKQNIKLRQELKLYESDDNYDGNVNNILDKIEMEFLKKENNELKYYIRNYSTLSKDLYKLQQLDKLVHVKVKKDLFITNPIKYDKYDNNKLVEHINLCNKLLVYNYYDSYNLATYDIREFISNMEDILTSPKYIRDDNVVYNDLINKIADMDDELRIYKSDEKLFMYHVEKVSYGLLKEIAKKQGKSALSIPFTCLSVALTELNLLRHLFDKHTIDTDRVNMLIEMVKGYMDGYDKGFLHKDYENNVNTIKRLTKELKIYKEKCKIYETQLTGLTNSKYKKVNIDEKTTNILNYIKQLLETNKLDNSQKQQCNIIIDKLNIEKPKDFNSDIYALKHYIFYLINYIVLQK